MLNILESEPLQIPIKNYHTHNNIKNKHKNQLQSLHSQSLLKLQPIYNKANELKLKFLNKNIQNNHYYHQQKCKMKYLQMKIDRNLQIYQQRKKYCQQNIDKYKDKYLNENQEEYTKHLYELVKGQKSNQKKKDNKKIEKDDKKCNNTKSSWKDHERNKTKSLVNFLIQNKNINLNINTKVKVKDKIDLNQVNVRVNTQYNTRPKSKLLQQQQYKHIYNDDDKFQPLGQQYKKQKLYQQSLKSQTNSIASSRIRRSSISSKHTLLPSRQNRQKSSQKYLRKGSRIRQILMKQLQSPQDRPRSQVSSGLSYLKQYDQWVPTILVQEKKQQLEAFMNVFYGDGKKAKKHDDIDLNKLQLIYL